MSASLDRLYKLLPSVYQRRDAAEGYPLKALLQVIAEQVTVVEEDIAQLYENWFIETSEDWVVPYLGDLIGYRPVTELGGFSDLAGLPSLSGLTRREVANTIRYRRQKGTLALLEELAETVAGWPARVVAFYPLLAQTQALKHLQPLRGRTVDLRQDQSLRYLNTPFEELAHTVDLRRLNSKYQQGLFNLPNVGLFVWRTKSYSLTAAPAFCRDRRANYYTFSILGNNTPLYVSPQREVQPTDIAGPLQLPVPIHRRDFEARKADFYGPNKSLQIFSGFISRTKPDQIGKRPIPVSKIIAADLTEWKHYAPPPGKVAVDPELGRLVVASDLIGEGIWVSYHYGFASEVGGGEYERAFSQADVTYRVSKYSVTYRVGQQDEVTEELGSEAEPLNKVLDQWAEDTKDNPCSAVIEITDNEEYVESLTIELAANQSLEIRAANGKRPVIRLLDYRANIQDRFQIKAQPGSRLTLDGLLITGRSVQVQGGIQALAIRHCTLVPGWSLGAHCEPEDANEPSLELIQTPGLAATIERSIIGSILVKQNVVETDPISLQISDTILDATRSDFEALSAGECRLAHAILTIKRSTVFGEIHTHAINLAENSIFTGQVQVGRRQLGCMRFCYVPPGSRTPRRYHCQPDLVIQAAQAASKGPTPEQEEKRVEPQFKSIRYGVPTYAQLALDCAEEIKQGADDESEMGVFHHLYNPQREANLRARLAEYTPADMEVGLIIVT